MSNWTILKKQIISINSIYKITQTMKLISTSKLKKIEKKILNLKPYSYEVYTFFDFFIKKTNNSIYKKKDNINSFNSTCWIIINSNLGLCGSYNININKMVLKQLQKNDFIIAIGLKAELFYLYKGFNVIKTKNEFDINLTYYDVNKFAEEILLDFNNKKYDSIKIAYTKFINNIIFEPTILLLLPIIEINNNKEFKKNNYFVDSDLEPEIFLKNMILIYLNTILFSIIIESQASEQGSRRLAMESASDNANNMLKKLSLLYNRKRQSIITQEIIEIIVAAAGIQEN